MTVHIVGGGLAGLATAVACVAQGRRTVVYEMSPRCGGRCATFADRGLGIDIDNGTHVVFGANAATMRYLAMTGGLASLKPDPSGRVTMVDVNVEGAFSAMSRLGWRDTIAMAKLALSWPGATAGSALNASRAVRTFWQPLCTAALNTPLREADARLLWRTVRRLLTGSQKEPVPMLAEHSVAATFIDPAVAWLRANGGSVETNVAIVDCETQEGHVVQLRSDDRTVNIGANDDVVLAVPFFSPLLSGTGLDANALVASPIFNVTYVIDGSPAASPHLTGLVGGTAQWLLRRKRTATVTVSAAEALIDRDGDTLAAEIWREIAPIVERPDSPTPPYRTVKERRATLRHTPAVQRSRPGHKTPWRNVVLAGDWVSPELPCTIESAIASGFRAAAAILPS